jgi:hypothetical protein
MVKRIDPPDTLDPVIGLLHRLQTEGWALDTVEHTVDYARPGDKARRIPVAAVVTVRLTPAR